MTITTEFIQFEKKKIFCRKTDIGADKTLLLVHGLAGDSRLFHSQLKYFATEMNVLAPDLPGHGRSESVKIEKLEDFTKILESITGHYNTGKIILLAHSMGGPIAIDYYTNHRDKIMALILVSTSFRFSITSDDLENAEKNFQSYFEDLINATYSSRSGLIMAAARRGDFDSLKNSILPAMKVCASLNVEKELENISVPVLVTANRQDAVIPYEMSISMAEKIPSSQLYIFENSGHIPFFENSGEFNSIVKNFILSL